MKKKLNAVLICSIFTLFTACVPTGQLDTFKSYQATKDKNHKIYVYTDCLVTSDFDGDGKFNELSMRYNKVLCHQISQNILAELSLLTDAEIVRAGVTVGLQAGPNMYAKTRNGSQMLPAFVGDTEVQPKQLGDLSAASKELSVFVFDYEERQSYIQSLLGRSYPEVSPNSGEALIIQISGINGLGGRKWSDATVDVLLALGGVMRYTYYPVSSRAIVLNKEGKVVWADAKFGVSYPVAECDSKRYAQDLLEFFPSTKEDPETNRRKKVECTPIGDEDTATL